MLLPCLEQSEMRKRFATLRVGANAESIVASEAIKQTTKVAWENRFTHASAIGSVHTLDGANLLRQAVLEVPRFAKIGRRRPFGFSKRRSAKIDSAASDD